MPQAAAEWVEYQEYIASAKWRARRTKFASKRTHCGICHVPKHGGMHVHHISYIRMGWEADEDLMLTCRKCHEAIHAFQQLEGCTVAKATRLCKKRAVVEGVRTVSKKNIKKRNKKSLAQLREEAGDALATRKAKIEERKAWLRAHTT